MQKLKQNKTSLKFWQQTRLWKNLSFIAVKKATNYICKQWMTFWYSKNFLFICMFFLTKFMSKTKAFQKHNQLFNNVFVSILAFLQQSQF